jgi:hypothetical protein
MKVTIKYEFLPEYEHTYFAKAWIGDRYFSECSSVSFDEAKQKLVKELVRYAHTPATIAPPPEEVEIEEAIHANQS